MPVVPSVVRSMSEDPTRLPLRLVGPRDGSGRFASPIPGRGAVWLARLTGGQEAGSSNLPSPTRKARSEGRSPDLADVVQGADADGLPRSPRLPHEAPGPTATASRSRASRVVPPSGHSGRTGSRLAMMPTWPASRSVGSVSSQSRACWSRCSPARSRRAGSARLVTSTGMAYSSGQVDRRSIATTPGNPSNARRSALTTVRPNVSAVAAMMRSCAPRGRPARRTATSRFACSSATVSS